MTQDNKNSQSIILGTPVNDVLKSNATGSILSAGRGNDTYLYNIGDGEVIIDESYVNSSDPYYKSNWYGNDKITFGSGIVFNELIFIKEGLDLVIMFAARSSDKIIIKNQFDNNTYNYVETMEFADGKVVGLNSKSIYLHQNGDETANEIYGQPYYNNVIDGQGGNDKIYAADGDDTIIGGQGDDYLSGGDGNDVYLYNLGDGKDVIDEVGKYLKYWNRGNDQIGFGAGIAKENLVLTRSGFDLIIDFNNSSADQIIIKNQFDGYSNGYANVIETATFLDGTSLDLTKAHIANYIGTDLNDTIYGDDGDNIINGKKGDDVLVGGAGNDTYFYNLGDGKDTIGYADRSIYYNGTTLNPGEINKIVFGEGISKDDVYFTLGETYFSGDVILRIRNSSSDQITLKNYLQTKQIQLLEFKDGTSIDLTSGTLTISYIGTDGNDSLNSRVTGSDIIEKFEGKYGDDTINADPIGFKIGGKDILIGGKGNDKLIGGYDDDIYVYNLGDGKDVISEYDSFGASDRSISYGFDTIELGVGITQENLILTRTQSDLIIGFKDNSSDRITIQNYFSGNMYKVELIKFADNSSVKIADLTPLINSEIHIVNGTDSFEFVYGTYGNDLINAKKGNDFIFGDTGDDTYIYNVGDGSDIIFESSFAQDGISKDMIKFGPKISPQNLIFSRSGDDLVILFPDNNSDKITIAVYFANDSSKIELVKFNDDSVFNLSDLLKNSAASNINVPENYNVINGTSYDDFINGTSGNDVIDGRFGKDTIDGGAGDDIYIFNRGSGLDTIIDSEGKNVIEFGPDVKKSDIILSGNATSGNVFIDIKNFSTDRITITGQLFDNAIKTLKFFDGQTIDLTDSKAINININGTNNSDKIEDTLYSDNINAQAGNDKIYLDSGNDTVNAGAGDDRIYVGKNNNIFTLGDGKDEILFTPHANGIDHVTDFTNQDLINLMIFKIKNFAELDIRQEGANAVIYLPDNQKIILDNFSAANLTENSFRFGTFSGDKNNLVIADNKLDFIHSEKGDDLIYIDSNAENGLDAGDGHDVIMFKNSITKETDFRTFVKKFNVSEDKIDLSEFTNIHNFSELSKFIYDTSNASTNGAEIDTSYVDFYLENVKSSDLTADNFIFAGADNARNINYNGNDKKITFDQTIKQRDLSFVAKAADLLIEIHNQDQDILIKNYFTDSNLVKILEFADGATLDISDSQKVLENNNHAPVAESSIVNQSVTAGIEFNFALANDIFSDKDNDVLTYNASLADNSALPDWLKFDAVSKSFSGTVPSGTVSSSLALKILASDGELSASQNFNLDIKTNIISGTSKGDNITGTDNADYINSGNGFDLVFAGKGDDTVNGGNQSDWIYGEDGNDILNGDAGDDVIDGGAGHNILTGGSGDDVFNFSALNSSNVITDFTQGHDQICVVDLGITNIAEDNDSASVAPEAGTLYYHSDTNTGQTILTDHKDFTVTFTGNVNLDNSDFIFGS